MGLQGKPSKLMLEAVLNGGCQDLVVRGLRLAVDSIVDGRVTFHLQLVDRDQQVLATYAASAFNLGAGDTCTISELSRLFEFSITNETPSMS